MAPATSTLDPFSAIAEPKRRHVLEVLAGGARPVNDLVAALGWPQPQVSKHLGVLKKVGLVTVRSVGRQRVYSLNAERLRPVHEWVRTFERFWTHQLGGIKARAEAKAAKAAQAPGASPNTPEPKEHRP